jgi:hypothetical protein
MARLQRKSAGSNTVNLDRINRRPAMEPLAPTSGISGAPLPKGGSFLDHLPIPVGVSVVARAPTWANHAFRQFVLRFAAQKCVT